jgi:hypothetical protein
MFSAKFISYFFWQAPRFWAKHKDIIFLKIDIAVRSATFGGNGELALAS